ncbi:hypothetical protein BRC90_07280 [Halobacteriales archaeon QS_4_69_34]|nr:MAG: hypothetical protein BRC90_07280 [Halobacteriales archaeon QS_4_69_34]
MTRNDTTPIDTTGTESDTTSAADGPALATVTRNLRERLSGIVGDERAVSPVIGFVLMFSIVIIAFTLYQVDVVPAQNAKAEFTHSQNVEEQLSELEDAIDRVSASGVSRSVTVSTGLQYPDRALAINPGTPSGSLRTSNPRSVDINNLETGDGHWDGGTFESRHLVYDANYNEYRNEPRIVIENGLSFNQFDSGYIVRSTDIISGTEIDLQLINGSSSGEYQESGDSVNVPLKSQSTSTEYLNVSSAGGTPTIELDTTLSEQAWKDVLGTDFSGADGTKRYAKFGGYTGSNPATVTVELESNQNYDFRMTEVGFRSVEKSPHYLTREDRQNRSVGSGETETVVVSARDEFGNPVSGVEVTLAGTTAPGTVTPSSAITNENGRATFTYEQTRQGAGEVEFEIAGATNARERVTYDINQHRTEGISIFSSNEVYENVGSITRMRIKNATPVIVDGCSFNATRYNNSSDFNVSDCNTTVPTLNVDFQVSPDSGNDYRGHVVLQDQDRNGEFGDGDKEISLVKFTEVKPGNNKVLAEGELDAQAVKDIFKDPVGTDLLNASNYYRGRLDIAPPDQTELDSGKIKVSNADLIVNNIRGRAVVELD